MSKKTYQTLLIIWNLISLIIIVSINLTRHQVSPILIMISIILSFISIYTLIKIQKHPYTNDEINPPHTFKIRGGINFKLK